MTTTCEIKYADDCEQIFYAENTIKGHVELTLLKPKKVLSKSKAFSLLSLFS